MYMRKRDENIDTNKPHNWCRKSVRIESESKAFWFSSGMSSVNQGCKTFFFFKISQGSVLKRCIYFLCVHFEQICIRFIGFLGGGTERYLVLDFRLSSCMNNPVFFYHAQIKPPCFSLLFFTKRGRRRHVLWWTTSVCTQRVQQHKTCFITFSGVPRRFSWFEELHDIYYLF